jgi:hypothetical protein
MNSIEELEDKFPNIEWHLPLKILWPDNTMFACRICIANHGLYKHSYHQWPTEIEAVDHIAITHLAKGTVQ